MCISLFAECTINNTLRKTNSTVSSPTHNSGRHRVCNRGTIYNIYKKQTVQYFSNHTTTADRELFYRGTINNIYKNRRHRIITYHTITST